MCNFLVNLGQVILSSLFVEWKKVHNQVTETEEESDSSSTREESMSSDSADLAAKKEKEKAATPDAKDSAPSVSSEKQPAAADSLIDKIKGFTSKTPGKDETAPQAPSKDLPEVRVPPHPTL